MSGTCSLHGRSVHQQCVSQQLPVQSQQVGAVQTVEQSVWKETEEDNKLVTYGLLDTVKWLKVAEMNRDCLQKLPLMMYRD